MDSSPPVAIRITRPYAAEEEFLEHEIETLSRTSVTLIGAQPRAQGVILRFELVLSSGQTLVRGEGRVVGFKPNAYRGLGGLTLRFTRLDSRSKAFVDRVGALRDQRRSEEGTAASIRPDPSHPELPILSLSAPELPAIPSSSPSIPELPPLSLSVAELPSIPASAPEVPAPSSSAPEFLSIPASAPEAPAAASRPSLPGAPAERDALLERLRTRAKAFGPLDVQRILDQRRRT